MKCFFKIIVLAAIFCFVVSCENSYGKKTLETNDAEPADSEITDEDNDAVDTETPDQDETIEPADQDSVEIPDETEDENAYGSITLKFAGTIGTADYPVKLEEEEGFAKDSFENSSNPIIPEYADKIRTEISISADSIQFMQTPIYADKSSGNPVIILNIPLDNADDGMYGINYNGDTSIVVVDFDWENSTTLCYHAFGEGRLEISDADIDNTNPFNEISFEGKATLYQPTNYKGEDISAEFLQIFTDSDMICDSVD